MTATTRQRSRILAATGAKLVAKPDGASSQAGLPMKLPDIEDVASFKASSYQILKNRMPQTSQHANTGVTVADSGFELSAVESHDVQDGPRLGTSRDEAHTIPSAASDVAASTRAERNRLADMACKLPEPRGLRKPRIRPLDHKHRGHLSVTDIKSCVRHCGSLLFSSVMKFKDLRKILF